jgi:hypothetical protein
MDNKQFETLKNQKMWIFMSMSMWNWLVTPLRGSLGLFMHVHTCKPLTVIVLTYLLHDGKSISRMGFLYKRKVGRWLRGAHAPCRGVFLQEFGVLSIEMRRLEVHCTATDHHLRLHSRAFPTDSAISSSSRTNCM